MKMKNEHNHESDEKKVEVKQLRIRIRKQFGDITSRPSKIIRQEIQIQREDLLETNDLRNLAQSLHQERNKAIFYHLCSQIGETIKQKHQWNIIPIFTSMYGI
jgi:hypothetical protein